MAETAVMGAMVDRLVQVLLPVEAVAEVELQVEMEGFYLLPTHQKLGQEPYHLQVVPQVRVVLVVPNQDRAQTEQAEAMEALAVPERRSNLFINN